MAINLVIGVSHITLVVDDKEVYTRNLNLIDNCSTFSNAWVHLNYFGIKSDSAPWESLLKYEIDKGGRVVLFKHIQEPLYPEEIVKDLPVIAENENVII